MNYLFGPDRAAHRRLDFWTKHAPACLNERRRHVVHGGEAKLVAIAQIQAPKVCVADTCRVVQHRLEHRRELAGRARDDAQNVRGRGLLLQQFAEIVRTLAQLVEQACIRDCDDGLLGEIADQCDLPVGERADFSAIDDDRADQLVLLEHRHCQV